MTQKKNFDTKFMVELALMIAIIIIMSLTPLGYIRTPGLSITLLTVPVAVGAVLLGPTGGAICGLGGMIQASGSDVTLTMNVAGGVGFTAIIVAWLSKFNTFIMVAVSFGIVFMDQGAVQIATQYGLNENASDVILGIILFFLIGAEFFINYRVKRAKK